MSASTGRDLVAAFDSIAPAIQAALPDHVPIERFRRVVLTAVQGNADLLAADRRSLLTGCLRAAQDGLLPDGREGALVTFRDRKAGILRVQWMPMVAGLMKLARQSGEVTAIHAVVVYEGEPFRILVQDGRPVIQHEVVLEAVDAGKPRAVYAVAHLHDGEAVREWMTWKQVMKVRAVSRAADSGPWATWTDEMAKKTVLRRLTKRLPMSTDRDAGRRFRQAVERVDEEHPRLVGPTAAAAGLLADEAGGGRLDGLEQHLAQTVAAEPAAAAVDNAEDLAGGDDGEDDFPGDRP